MDDLEVKANKVSWLAAKATHGRRWTVTLQGPLCLSLSLLTCWHDISESHKDYNWGYLRRAKSLTEKQVVC